MWSMLPTFFSVSVLAPRSASGATICANVARARAERCGDEHERGGDGT